MVPLSKKRRGDESRSDDNLFLIYKYHYNHFLITWCAAGVNGELSVMTSKEENHITNHDQNAASRQDGEKKYDVARHRHRLHHIRN
ncbi:hypothetical protein K0U27_11150 [archaeon]|nr:hypothetical protein [archaeon]